ncbi:MAG: hypothetical protein C4551_09480 [Bacillota bacterium]|nr:MAG: hypothetical protein C4551_09480 [Bacillota bacterium]
MGRGQGAHGPPDPGVSGRAAATGTLHRGTIHRATGDLLHDLASLWALEDEMLRRREPDTPDTVGSGQRPGVPEKARRRHHV